MVVDLALCLSFMFNFTASVEAIVGLFFFLVEGVVDFLFLFLEA